MPKKGVITTRKETFSLSIKHGMLLEALSNVTEHKKTHIVQKGIDLYFMMLPTEDQERVSKIMQEKSLTKP